MSVVFELWWGSGGAVNAVTFVDLHRAQQLPPILCTMSCSFQLTYPDILLIASKQPLLTKQLIACVAELIILTVRLLAAMTYSFCRLTAGKLTPAPAWRGVKQGL